MSNENEYYRIGGQSYTTKINLGLYWTTFFLLQVHRNLLHLIILTKTPLKIWSNADELAKEDALVKFIDTAKEEMSAHVRKMLAIVKRDDPSLILFHLFMGYMITTVVIAQTSTAKANWGGEFYFTYCHLLVNLVVNKTVELENKKYDNIIRDIEDSLAKSRQIRIMRNRAVHDFIAKKKTEKKSDPIYAGAACSNAENSKTLCRMYESDVFLQYPTQYDREDDKSSIWSYFNASKSIVGPFSKLARLLTEIVTFQFDVNKIALRVSADIFGDDGEEVLPSKGSVEWEFVTGDQSKIPWTDTDDEGEDGSDEGSTVTGNKRKFDSIDSDDEDEEEMKGANLGDDKDKDSDDEPLIVGENIVNDKTTRYSERQVEIRSSSRKLVPAILTQIL